MNEADRCQSTVGLVDEVRCIRPAGHLGRCVYDERPNIEVIPGQLALGEVVVEHDQRGPMDDDDWAGY